MFPQWWHLRQEPVLLPRRRKRPDLRRRLIHGLVRSPLVIVVVVATRITALDLTRIVGRQHLLLCQLTPEMEIRLPQEGLQIPMEEALVEIQVTSHRAVIPTLEGGQVQVTPILLVLIRIRMEEALLTLPSLLVTRARTGEIRRLLEAARIQMEQEG